MIHETATVLVHERTRQFHLTNGLMSYVFAANDEGKLLQLYAGPAVPDREDFSHLAPTRPRPMATCPLEGNLSYSLEHLRQEFPEYGTSDYRRPAVSIRQENGATITDLRYEGHRVMAGKPRLEGLPATYVDSEDEAVTLQVTLSDALTGLRAILDYTLFRDLPVLTRSVRLVNDGNEAVDIERLACLNLDLPDCSYDMVELVGAWARERAVRRQHLHPGTQSIESLRGASGHAANPVAAFCRPDATEDHGQVIGLGFVYSGSFQISAQVDAYDVTRLQVGFDDFTFRWHLEPGASFQSPEAVMVLSREGFGGMSDAFHRLVLRHLVRGPWRDRERPVLINNWEATYFDFDEEQLLEIARRAQDAGVELFVLDDGWFGERQDDTAGLGDWTPNPHRLPSGLGDLARRIGELGMRFGLWFEPEMVNRHSRLFEAHPEWVIQTPRRRASHGRNQYVLNFADDHVVDAIYEQMHAILSSADIAYIKWDMNRNISEAYDLTRDARHQGEIFHRYMLGVYALHERLLTAFPGLIIEGCASGGGRFDLGMLHYVQQIWTSDDTDAVERIGIQYGTSLFYPLSVMGSHVSVTPNHQTGRITPLDMRTNVAMFGTFGFELDLSRLTAEQFASITQATARFKQYRELIHAGRFHRLLSPFEQARDRAAWMVVADDRRTALVSHYRILSHPNGAFTRLVLRGLDPAVTYRITRPDQPGGYAMVCTGAELMHAGLVMDDDTSDFASHLFLLEATDPDLA